MPILLPPLIRKPGFSPFAEVWSSNGTSTVPSGNPQWATIVCWGGGGAGQKGDGSSLAGPGGHGGMFSISTVNVVNISQLHIVVGRGGAVHNFSLTANVGQNTVVRYSNSTGTIVARADRAGGTTTVRTDYANVTSWFTSRQSDGGSGGSAAADAFGGGGGAPGTDGGIGGNGLSGGTRTSNHLGGSPDYEWDDPRSFQGEINSDSLVFPPWVDETYAGVGYGGKGGDSTSGAGEGVFAGVTFSTAAVSGSTGRVLIYWGDPSYWNSIDWTNASIIPLDFFSYGAP